MSATNDDDFWQGVESLACFLDKEPRDTRRRADRQGGGIMTAARRRLPNRRNAELLDFECNGFRYTATVGGC
jgi:hypothetical protein